MKGASREIGERGEGGSKEGEARREGRGWWGDKGKEMEGVERKVKREGGEGKGKWW